MLGKLKGFLLGFVKSEVLNNLGMLDTLATPELVALLTSKAKLAPDQAAALASDVIGVAKTAITNLLDKI